MFNLNSTIIHIFDKITYSFIYLYSYLEIQYAKYLNKPNDTLAYTFSDKIENVVDIDFDILKIIDKYNKK
jgi:hypothetical protein